MAEHDGRGDFVGSDFAVLPVVDLRPSVSCVCSICGDSSSHLIRRCPLPRPL